MKIRRRVYRSGQVGWQVDFGLVEGKRVQRAYESEKDALAAIKQAGVAQARHGLLAGALSAKEMAEIVLAKERLKMTGASISEAVDFYLLHAGAMTKPKKLRQLIDLFTDAKERSGCSERYVRQLRVSLGAVEKAMPGVMAHEVTREDVEAWLRSGSWAARTKNGYLGDVASLYSWAMREGYARMNPAVKVDRARVVEGEIGTLTFEQCEELLRAALNEPHVMPYLVLGLFGGLRPAEIERLHWHAVDLGAGTVIVSGAQAKTRQRRVVDLSANAVAWILASGVEMQGKLCGRWWDGRWRLFRHALGWAVGAGDLRVPRPDIKPVHGLWPQNALRHTFASMHYAHHQNEAALQVQMGHESAAMLHRHYRAIKTRAEAERFWSLKP
jgi:integrase